MKTKLIVIILATLLTSCKSEFDLFKDKIIEFANIDKQIDQKEYEELLEIINQSDERDFQKFKNKNGEITNDKIVSYLLKHSKDKNVNLTENDIWQPVSNNAQGVFSINVYLENSASMDGYVKGVTDFENAIYNLLADFKISGLCDSLNLNYINSKPIPFPPDVQDFITKLEPSTFKDRGGDRSVSDLQNILSTVLKSVNDKNAAVLISDFVFSLGKHENADEYLINQGIGIKMNFAEKLKEFDLSAIVIQLESNFDGMYYREKIGGKEVKFTGKRPYYVWIFGNTQQISSILKTKMLDNIKGGYSNRLVFQPIKEINVPNYKILYSPKIGSYSAKQLKRKIISDASVSKDKQNKGLFGFRVAVDFSKSLQDYSYFSDTDNYILSNSEYKLEIELITDQNDASSLAGFTHLLILETNKLIVEVLKIDIVGKMPSWVFNTNSIDDSNILNDIKEQQKTFGLKHLIEGVNDAFYPKSNSNSINSISITIKK